MKVCFFGTPDFALPSLKALINGGYDVLAVVTQPSRPKGRSGKLADPPVKQIADAYGIKALQYDKLRAQGVEELKALGADIFVTAAYGQILSQEILDIPPLGCVNVHGSLLPKYRGPAPIQWSIIEGETVTGVTTMYTDIGVDTGDMILKAETEIGGDETAGQLFDRLAELGAKLLIETLELIAQGKAPRTPQNEAEATRYPMLRKEHGRIDWRKSTREIANLVRGVDPWPGAYGILDGDIVKIWRVSPAADIAGKPGDITAHHKLGIFVKTGDGSVGVEELQLAGGKRLQAADFLRGRGLGGCFDA